MEQPAITPAHACLLKSISMGKGIEPFLTAAMQYRMKLDDGTIVSRVYGMDKDPQAFELAVVNMILNKDGQTYLREIDSIANPDIWTGEMGVALCNPPFGARTLETRPEVLAAYDLGHVWECDSNGEWTKTKALLPSQQLGILFIERCFKLLQDDGRIGIILPEGYLCTASYGFVRQWILNNFRIFGLVELPRRIFLKSDADLRSNILFATKDCGPKDDYPIHTELVRKVGYKLGKGFFGMPLRDFDTGLEVRDNANKIVIDSDFERVKNNFAKFTSFLKNDAAVEWNGARLSDILSHPSLDMKPRRLTTKALDNIRAIKSGEYVRLGDIADVVTETIDINETYPPSELLHLIEGQDIRAVEGVVVLKDAEKRWKIENRKTSQVYPVSRNDVIVGLVRPERRNIGIYTGDEELVFASPDGVAIVREKDDKKSEFPIEWIFHALRTERCRIQFWTESGGTSYGKLTLDQIRNVLIAKPSAETIKNIAASVTAWADSVAESSKRFHSIWEQNDKVVILNSPVIGLEGGALFMTEDPDECEIAEANE